MSSPDSEVGRTVYDTFDGPARPLGENLNPDSAFHEERVYLGAEERADAGEAAFGEVLRRNAASTLGIKSIDDEQG